jgi:membrane-bound inhibitor of C-type lysozyme
MLRYRLSLALTAAVLSSGCSSVNLWPFGSEGAREYSRTPANATEYQCDGGKRFYVRELQGGSVWIILAERQFRLDKIASPEGTRYGNGTATLDVNGAEATLRDGGAVAFIGCKAATAANK